jgi:hypothetical protein
MYDTAWPIESHDEITTRERVSSRVVGKKRRFEIGVLRAA